MASADSSWNDWLRTKVRAVTDHPTGQAACEAVAAVLLIGEAAALLWWHSALAVPVQILLWAQVVATAGALRWAGLFPLFGPVLVFDLVRTARRNRYFFIRMLYAGTLAIILFWGYFLAYVTSSPRPLTNNDMVRFSSGIFYTFMIVQFALAALLTPAYTAGAIAEEKDRKTLPFLLATDLRDREIILGKLMSRLLNLTLFVLTGLPILSFLQFVGGIDPGLLLAGFAATFLTMLGLASLSLFNSVLTKKARDAIVMTYVEAVAYLALSGMSWLLFLLPPAWTTFPSTATWASPITVGDLVEWFNAGNLVAVVGQIFAELTRGGRLDLLVPKLLRNYALFHFLLSLLCLGWAVYRLRPQALKEAGDVPRVRRRLFSLLPRPRVGSWPMIWKELFIERGFRLHWLARIVVAVLIIASFLPVAGIVSSLIYELNHPYAGPGPGAGWAMPPDFIWERFRQEMNIWVRFMSMGISCLMLVAVAVRAAGSISGERDRQTFDDLLTSPLGSDAMLFGKWLGSLCSVRWAWLWLLTVWATAGICGALHPVAVALHVAAWCIYAAFLANLGLWSSMVSRTTLRAIVGTLTSALGLAFGHWLIWLLFVPLFVAGPGSPPRAFEWLAKFQFGLTPPFALWGSFSFGLFPEDNNLGVFRTEWLQMVAFGVFGLVFWGVATVILWVVVSARFRDLTNRSNFYRFRFVGGKQVGHPRLREPVIRRDGRERAPAGKPAWIEDVIPVPEEEEAEVLPADEPPPRGG
jgi:ABC-type transport system involved in multi-copper enzyme maturation permease subunit